MNHCNFSKFTSLLFNENIYPLFLLPLLAAAPAKDDLFTPLNEALSKSADTRSAILNTASSWMISKPLTPTCTAFACMTVPPGRTVSGNAYGTYDHTLS